MLQGGKSGRCRASTQSRSARVAKLADSRVRSDSVFRNGLHTEYFLHMKILFVTAHKYLPQVYAGLQTSTDELCKGLLARGHRVCVLAGFMPEGWFGLTSRLKMRLRSLFTRDKVARDTGLGYPVWRSWSPWDNVAYVARKEKPDLIVVMATEVVRMASAAKLTKVPILIQLMDVEFKYHGGCFVELGDIACIANSVFTADKYHKAYGIESVVIYPFIAPEKYKTPTTRENVTFINPVTVKGRDLAIEIARRCPEIPFSFIEGWPQSPKERDTLLYKISALSNVSLSAVQKDMRNVYGKCKILLAPSLWEEAYGRVATEAQFSGIPVVASNRGGLPEAVGPGGVVIDPDGPVEEWVSVIRDVWQNEDRYQELSAAATAYAHRPEMTYAFLLDSMEQCFLGVCNQEALANTQTGRSQYSQHTNRQGQPGAV